MTEALEVEYSTPTCYGCGHEEKFYIGSICFEEKKWIAKGVGSHPSYCSNICCCTWISDRCYI